MKIFQENMGRVWAYAPERQIFTNLSENLTEIGHTSPSYERLKIFQENLGRVWVYAPEFKILKNFSIKFRQGLGTRYRVLNFHIFFFENLYRIMAYTPSPVPILENFSRKFTQDPGIRPRASNL